MERSPVQTWTVDGEQVSARFVSEADDTPPEELTIAGDQTRADQVLARIRAGESLLYRGDFHNALQLISAIGRRIAPKRAARAPNLREAFFAERQARWREHRQLASILVEVDGEYRLALKRAPDVREACEDAWGPADGTRSLVSLRQLQGMMGAAEWHRKGIDVPALKAKIHPRYGVFAPTRQEYVELVAKAKLPEGIRRAFDVGTGTGVLAVLLARKGVPEVIATDVDPRAVACAQENVERLGLTDGVKVEQRPLFPEGQADLIVCNPPWIPARPRTPVDRAIFDPDNAMLTAFMKGVRQHLTEQGQAWLVISDLAERLQLRPEGFIQKLAEENGLQIASVSHTAPKHGKASDRSDPLHAARSQERTALWVLIAPTSK